MNVLQSYTVSVSIVSISHTQQEGKGRPTNMNGIKGMILPLSHAPPTAIAQTVAQKIS